MVVRVTMATRLEASLGKGRSPTMYSSAANTMLEAVVDLAEHMAPVMLMPRDSSSALVGLSPSLAEGTVPSRIDGQICRVPA